jgi:hypothetical protein
VAKKGSNGKEQKGLTVTLGRLQKGLLLTAFLAFAVTCAGVVQAGDNGGFDHVATTHADTRDTAPPWQMAEAVCCHCYSTLSNGTRFYHGVLEAGFCRAQRGYCEGYAKCFP